MPALVVVSLAALNAPHRKPYDLLARRYGWEVHLVVPRLLPIAGGADKPCDPAPSGVAYTFHPVDLWNTAEVRLTWFHGLSAVARAARPDAVFVEYDPGTVAVLEAFAVTRPYRSKIIAYTVENLPDARWQKARAHLLAGAVKPAARDAAVAGLHAAGRAVTDAIACLNDDGQRIYRDLWRWPQPTEVVPLGTDLDLFHPRDASARRAALGLGDAFVLGYFGRLIPEKGVHHLVEALPALPPRVKLLLDMYRNFSPGSYAASLLSRADELGVRDRIVTIDVPHGEVPEYMACCDAIALVSTETPRFKEQFGRVLPEAMATGVPVICTDTGYLPVIAGDAGIVIPRDTPDALVAAVRSLVDDEPRRRDLVRRGLERVRARWSIDVQAERLDALLRRVV